jgi:phosphatidylglycerol lysyltransferase
VAIAKINSSERERVLSLLKSHGWNATSFQILEEGFRYWFDGDEACVAYVDTGSAWVVAGTPVAVRDHVGEVALRFVDAAKVRGKRVCFFGTERRFSAVVPFASMQIGEQPVWDPRDWDDTVRKTPSLKEQLRRARAKGVVVRRVSAEEIVDHALPTRAAIEALIGRWLRSRSMAPMGFLVDVQPFAFAAERKYFVAEHAERIVGFLASVPVYARNGWFLEDLVRDPGAPNGTSEALVDAALRNAADEGSEYATLGLAPMAGAEGWLRAIKQSTSALYDFHGVHAFKAKLRPTSWEPIYLAYPSVSGGNRALYDSLAAFARGSFARFGVQTLLRGPAIVVRILAALLVPWTILLALADGPHFFPWWWVKWGWVLFDCAMVVALFVLSARWRRSLGIVVAAAVTADSVLTLAQAIFYNVPRARSVLDAVVILAACLAPSFAAITLWGAVSRSSRSDPRKKA